MMMEDDMIIYKDKSVQLREMMMVHDKLTVIITGLDKSWSSCQNPPLHTPWRAPES